MAKQTCDGRFSMCSAFHNKTFLKMTELNSVPKIIELYCPHSTKVLHGIEGNAWYCIVLHGIEWYCMILIGTAWYCIVLHDIEWYCMVLLGIARYWMVLQ